MPQASLHVVGIGNAIVDVIAHADDAFIETNGLEKGAMTLIDADGPRSSTARWGRGSKCRAVRPATPGRHRLLGGKGAYIGKVSDDQLGQVFRHDIRAIGVQFDSP